MLLKIFTINDSKARAYISPFFLPELGMATRTFKNMVNDRAHQFSQNPFDYTLFHIGHFDVAAGTIEGQTPISLGNGVEFIDKPILPANHELELDHQDDPENFPDHVQTDGVKML